MEPTVLNGAMYIACDRASSSQRAGFRFAAPTLQRRHLAGHDRYDTFFGGVLYGACRGVWGIMQTDLNNVG